MDSRSRGFYRLLPPCRLLLIRAAGCRGMRKPPGQNPDQLRDVSAQSLISRGANAAVSSLSRHDWRTIASALKTRWITIRARIDLDGRNLRVRTGERK